MSSAECFCLLQGTEILKPSSAYQKSDLHGIFLNASVSLTSQTLVAMWHGYDIMLMISVHLSHLAV